MQRDRLVDIYSAVSRALVYTARFDFVAVYYDDLRYNVHATNFAAYFSDFVSPGRLVLSINFAKIKYGELDAATLQNIKHLIEQHNATVAQSRMN